VYGSHDQLSWPLYRFPIVVDVTRQCWWNTPHFPLGKAQLTWAFSSFSFIIITSDTRSNGSAGPHIPSPPLSTSASQITTFTIIPPSPILSLSLSKYTLFSLSKTPPILSTVGPPPFSFCYGSETRERGDGAQGSRNTNLVYSVDPRSYV